VDGREVYLIADDAPGRGAVALLLRDAGFATRVYDNGAAFLEDSGQLPAGCVIARLKTSGMRQAKGTAMDFARRTGDILSREDCDTSEPPMTFRPALILALILAAAAPVTAFAQAATAAAPPSGRSAKGVGVVTEINAEEAVITLRHEPIPALGWPSMVMPFHLASPDLLKGLKVGQKIAFDTTEAQGLPEITAIRKP
jgi:Cu/Ag efflux protein CusF